MQIQALQLRPYGYIYKVTNNFNGKCYIGQSVDNPKERWYRYKTLKCTGQHKLYNTLKKNGPDNFTYEIIATGSDKTNLDFLEDAYEICYDSINNGYNIRRGGANGRHSRETIQKMSKAHTGKKHSDATKQKISDMKKNQIITEKHKQQISEAFKGKKRSDGDKLKISNAKIGIRTTFLTKESRNKISKSLKGAGSYNFGKHLSMETKTKISLALKNKRRKIILQS